MVWNRDYDCALKPHFDWHKTGGDSNFEWKNVSAQRSPMN